MLVRATTAAGMVATAGAAVPFLASLAPSERAKVAGAPVDVDINSFRHAELHTVEWRGRPVWILRRDDASVKRLHTVESQLTDPASAVSSQQPAYAHNRERSIRPDVFVAVGLCTHLGCIPSFFPAPGSVDASWPGGFYCPCHGSRFDLAGRVFRSSPAPTNLLVPPHRYLSDTTLVIGEDGADAGARAAANSTGPIPDSPWSPSLPKPA